MSSFIQNLLVINAGMAVVIAVFALLRYLFKGKVHTKILCILWIIIFLRMLIPVPIESNFSIIESDFVQASYIAAENYAINYGTNDAVTEETEINTSENIRYTNYTTPVYHSVKDIDIILLIYICGVCIALAYILISNSIFNSKIRKEYIEIELNDADKQVFAEQRIKSLKVYLVEDLKSPCLAGAVRPRIILNRRSAADDSVRRYCLYHETTHYKHKDNFLFLLGLLACIINWFNPLMWLALNLFNEDRELYCDESVIKKIGEQEIIDYGKSLLFVAQSKSNRLLTVPTTMAGGKKEMKQRIKNLAENKKCWIAVFVAIVVILLITSISIIKPKEIPAGIDNEIQEISNVDEYPEFTTLFDEARDSSNIDILRIYRTDINKDGTDELYTNSYVRNDRYPPIIIECYDLETDTYSNLTTADGRAHYIMVFRDKLYIFVINEDGAESDVRFNVYEPYLSYGKLSYKKIDTG